ncbi:MAG TPA: aminotransferase class V-fold PLP-dependent enzyme [bacterium]|nr:aminotransferase class V-fold PLP-dependent enzyme [bacterium]
MQRRFFLKSIGLAAGGVTLAGPLSDASGTVSPQAEQVVSQLSPEDDRFWHTIRRQFLLPEDYVYVNTGGLGASPAVVLEEVQHGMHQLEVRPRPGHDPDRWNDLKEKCAGMFGRECRQEEIALTGSTTEGNNIVLNGLSFRRGDEIITSTHEHAGLNIPLLNTQQRSGVVIKTFEPDLVDGLENVNRIADLITQNTRLIFISHITCTTGQRLPVEKICQLARDKGIPVALDGAQVVGNMPIDVGAYGCDFYATSGHKWLIGPKRTGVFYVREDRLDTLRPTTVGAYSEEGYHLPQRELGLHPTAQRYEYATQNEPLMLGLGIAIDFLTTIGMETIWNHNKQLAEMCYHGLREIPGVELLSPREEKYRTSLITFRIPGHDYREVAYTHLMDQGFRARGVGEADLGGIRFSFHLYNTGEEVERILQAVRMVVEG